MSDVVQSGGNYSGLEAGKLIGGEIIKGDSLSQGVFTIRQNAKGKSVLRTIDVDASALQGALCDFTPDGGDIVNKEVDLAVHNVNMQLCKDELNFDFTAFDMNPGADGSLNGDAVAAISSAIMQRVAIAVDKEIWTNIVAEAVGDASAIKTNLAVFTVDNILDEIGKVYTLLAKVEGFSTGDAVIVLTPQDKALYEQALAKGGAMPTFYIGEKGTNYLGVRIVASEGMVSGSTVGSFTSNLYYLTDLDNDRNQVGVKDMGDVDFSNNIRFKAHWYQAASYARGNRMVLGSQV